MTRRHGFTLIELLVALTIVALLLSIAAPRYVGSLDLADEAVLRENLALTRDALDKHFADTGRYPTSINELVTKRYLRAIPTDPITRSQTTWILVAPSNPKLGLVYDLKSGAKGTGGDGRPYGQW
jgi:general secretion pathway protein G